jgi:hypothetical protein
VAIPIKDLKIASNIGNNFKNPTLEQGKLKSAVRILSGMLNSPFETIENVYIILVSQVKRESQKVGKIL